MRGVPSGAAAKMMDVGVAGFMDAKCFVHKNAFPDTHRNIRPALEISRNVPIVCGGLELKQSNLKTNMPGFAANVFEKSVSAQRNYGTPNVNKQGLSNAIFRIEISYELRIQDSFLSFYFYKCDTIIFAVVPFGGE